MSMGQAMAQGVQVSLKELLELRPQAKAFCFHTMQRVKNIRLGGHLSQLRGRGIEFDEVRAYQAGDDIRQMDWRVTAKKCGRPHVKLYHEERERPVYFIVDFNPSMFFATRVAFKSVWAAKIAALLAWRAHNDGDRVGGFLFNGQDHLELPAIGHQRGVLHLLKGLSEYSQQSTSGVKAMSNALARMCRVLKHGGLIFIISDFLNLDEESVRYLSQLKKHHELVTIKINDRIELSAPPPNEYQISDGIQTRFLNLRSDKVRSQYIEYFNTAHQQYSQTCKKYNIPNISLTTDDDCLNKVKQTLAQYARSF